MLFCKAEVVKTYVPLWSIQSVFHTGKVKVKVKVKLSFYIWQ
jgi:hypothetical protein